MFPVVVIGLKLPPPPVFELLPVVRVSPNPSYPLLTAVLVGWPKDVCNCG